MKDLSNYRKSYEKSELLETNIPEDPINLFHKWFYETEEQPILIFVYLFFGTVWNAR